MTVEAQSRPPTSAVAPSAGALATMAPKPAASPAVVPSGKADDLTLIRAVDRATADKLVRLGVTRFEQIARWRADDVARANGALGLYGRVERENWIEQARILASGGATEFSRRVDKGDVETSRLKS